MRLATFNCENLFARYRFNKKKKPVKENGFTINNLAFDIYDNTNKRITANAIREVDADVIALQEVEGLPVLDRFNVKKYMKDCKYPYAFLVDSHDPRSIDVALLSRHPIVWARTYRDEINPETKRPLFSRDCLVVHLDVKGKPLVLYVNHLKSMMGGRSQTKPKRQKQAKRVAKLIRDQWASQGYQGNYVVLGDLNDYPGQGTALNSLLNHPGLENVVKRLPQDEQWTHYYAKKKQYTQLDYLLLSPSLAQANPGLPGVMRKGLPKRAVKYTGKRLSKVGENKPKASDHCPLYMDLELA
ncbi:MAG: endonuclease/exonuclease/phosphatase family protein [Desulfarculaceae bacterium]|jgi:endonuclease/exonuclease/phosphatase family metal-dependent hydrolase